MKKVSIECEKYFLIRTPRMPVNILLEMNADMIETRKSISEWVMRPEVIEALYIATPSLVKRLKYWHKDPSSKNGRKVEAALLKYMIRMKSRPTPFGLFSGIALGRIGSATRLQINSLKHDTRKTRLDVSYLSTVKEHIKVECRTRDNLEYFPNPSRYSVSDQWRYIQTYQSADGYQYRLNAIGYDEYIDFVFRSAENGASFSSLVNAFLKNYPDGDRGVVEGYIRELIDESVLVAKIPLPITGISPDVAFVNSLRGIGKHSLADNFSKVLSDLKDIDNRKESSLDDYKQVVSRLRQLPPRVDESRLFQTDIYRSFEQCELNKTLISRLLNQLLILKGLGAPERHPLGEFVAKFKERYEGQYIPLDRLLDDESGINFSLDTGYEAPIIAGLNLAKNRTTRSFVPEESILDKIVNQAITVPENRNKELIQLSSEELERFLDKSSTIARLPASFAALISVFGNTEENLLIKFNGCYGPSSAKFLGRFCHLNCDLQAEVRAHLLKEEQHSPDVIFAEIAHMPEGRSGNVIARPRLRSYEIVFLADSSADLDFQIAVSDLCVWVEAEQIKLWSKRLNKQIVPRLSSAHNYSSRSLSVYKFLCMLQSQSGTTPGFSLPVSQAQAVFVPRIMLDNLILSEKTWRIPRSDLDDILKDGEVDEKKLSELKSKYNLDDIVSYTVVDNALQINLQNPVMLEILLGETRRQERVELKEVLVSKYETPVKSSDNQYYCNDIIIPIYNSGARKHQTLGDDPQKHINAKPIKRRFSPGTEWLSLKLYSGNDSVEDMLARQIYPLIHSSKELVDKWFFVRFGDPDWHIRVRFNGKPELLYGQFLPKLSQLLDPAIECGAILKSELSTYEREVERYGGPNSIEVMESIFMADSQLITSLIRSLGDESFEDLRWRVALLVTDRLLDLFHYADAEKLEVINHLRNSFGNEFNYNSALRRQLGSRYREIKSTLVRDFSRQGSNSKRKLSHKQQIFFPLIARWQKDVTPFVQNIERLFADENGLNCSINTLLYSLIHMHNNRMFKAYNREQEMVMHDFLWRILKIRLNSPDTFRRS